jgi:hypothetical protein
MRFFKLADLAGQGILIVGGVIYAIQHTNNGQFLSPYYVVGSWQLISFVFHASSEKNLFFRKERMAYGKTILWLIGIGIISWILILVPVPLILFYLFGLLIISPCLAIWYFTICFREVQLMNKKALVHLK